jgi:peroxiredoxin
MMAVPKPGERAPEFALFVRSGDPVRLSAALQEGPVVLLTYPNAWGRG